MLKEYFPGYLLKVQVYERDADHYDKIEHNVPNKEQVRFLLEFYKMFGPTYKNGANWGNTKTPIETIITEVEKLKYEYRLKYGPKSIPEIFQLTPEELIDLDLNDIYSDILYDTIGRWNYGEYWRVFDLFEVFLIPEGIQNITREFSGE